MENDKIDITDDVNRLRNLMMKAINVRLDELESITDDRAVFPGILIDVHGMLMAIADWNSGWRLLQK